MEASPVRLIDPGEEPPNESGSRGRTRGIAGAFRGRGPRILAGVGLAAITALSVAGYIAYDDLQRTHATLADTLNDLASTRRTLDVESRERRLAESRVVLLERDVSSLEQDAEDLRARIANQAGCIAALGDDVSELAAMHAELIANFNRTAEDSSWARARKAQVQALNDAADAYYEAYRAAFLGSYNSANDWVDRGNELLAEADDQLENMVSAVEEIDLATEQLSGRLDAFAAAIGDTAEACGVDDSSIPA